MYMTEQKKSSRTLGITPIMPPEPGTKQGSAGGKKQGQAGTKQGPTGTKQA